MVKFLPRASTYLSLACGPGDSRPDSAKETRWRPPPVLCPPLRPDILPYDSIDTVSGTPFIVDATLKSV